MIYLFWGQDDFSLHQAVAEVKAGLGDLSWREMNITELEGRASPPVLEEAVRALPLFLPQRLVIVRGLLARFEPRRERPSPPSELPALLNLLEHIPPTALLLLIEERFSPANPLFKGLQGKATIRSFPPVRGRELHRWIEARVAQGGGRIHPRAVRLLAGLAGESLWGLSQEIEKLFLYTQGEPIEEGAVERVVWGAGEANIYRVAEALLQGRAARTSQALHHMLQRGMAAPQLLTLLARQFRLILQAREMLSQGVKEAEIGQRLGLTHPYAVEQTIAQAKAHSLSRLETAYRRLLETDLSIKTGRWEEGLALDLLVAALCPSG